MAAIALSASFPLVSTSAEWRFASEGGPNGNTVLLSESPSLAKGCKGKMEASEQMYALGKWMYIRELCYELDKAGNVKLTDPEKMMFFNTFKMPASGFTRIPTEEERAAARLKRDQEDQSRAVGEMVRQLNSQQQRRPSIVCNHLGDTTICD